MGYNNVSQAIIKSGAKINQNSLYQTDTQSVVVNATTSMTLLNATGIISFDLNIDGIVKGVKKADPSEVFSFSGNKAKSGIGGSAVISVMDNSTVAKIEDAAKIHTGALGDGLGVRAKTDIFTLMLAQAGGDAETLGVSGSFSVLNQKDRTIAQIESGAEVIGGKVNVSADDNTIQITLVGAVQTAEGTGVGISTGVFNVNRDTQAIVGKEITDTDSTAGTKSAKITAAGDVTVKALNQGGVGTLTVAGAIVNDSLADQVLGKKAEAEAALKDARSLFWDENDAGGGISQGTQDNLNNKKTAADKFKSLGQAATDSKQGAGLGIAGNIAINIVNTKTQAYINDNAKIDITNNGDLILDSTDQTVIVGASGALSLVNKPEGTAVGISGAFSLNLVNNNTKAFVTGGAKVSADQLTITAVQKGFIATLTGAGSSATSGTGGGVGVAGNISVNIIQSKTEAYTTGNSEFTLANGATITAKDQGQIWSIAGAVGFGGKGGVGLAVAANILGTNDNPATAKAYIENSKFTTKKGAIALSATNDAFFTDSPRIIAITGSGGIAGGSEGIGLAGMVSVNLIDGETAAYVKNSTIIDDGADANPASVSLFAQDSSWIISLGGALGVGSNAGVGAAVGYNQIASNVRTYVEGSTLNLAGALTLNAISKAQIQGVTVGIGVGTGASGLGGAGSASINIIQNTIDSHISSSSNITTGGAIAVKAKDSSLIVSISGGVTVSKNAAVGASISYNLIQNNIQSYIDNSIIRGTTSTEITAIDGAVLVAVSVGGAGAQGFALGGSLTICERLR